MLPEELESNQNINANREPDLSPLQTHHVSENSLNAQFNDLGLQSVKMTADGNCLPRTGSFISMGTEDSHLEIRIRIVHELVQYEEMYLNEDFLVKGTQHPRRSYAPVYAQYSPFYVPGTTVSKEDINAIYSSEVMDIIKLGSYCGI